MRKSILAEILELLGAEVEDGALIGRLRWRGNSACSGHQDSDSDEM